MAENEDASYHGLARSKRRDAKRQRRKKMVVTGRGVFTINRLLGERAQKAREGQDESLPNSGPSSSERSDRSGG